MTKKYKKQRPHTPAWLDTLIVWLEVIGLIGTLLAGIYALASFVTG